MDGIGHGITELANMFKKNENVFYPGGILGTVLVPPPNIKVAIGDIIVLDKEDLVISAHVLQGYKRTFIEKGNIKFTDNDCGSTSDSPGNPGPPPTHIHSHGIKVVNIDTDYVEVGEIELTNTLKAGDPVILIPSQDEQTYFLVDRGVIL